MQRVATGGTSIALEIWEVPVSGLASVLMEEPSGLCIGKVSLSGGDVVLGVLGEAMLCEGQEEITKFGGWRAFYASRATE
jgi:hypothetical protein